MSHILIGFVVIIAGGAFGGLINCALSNEFKLPKIDRDTGIWRPGWVGNVIIGIAASGIVGCLYGPFSSVDIFAVAADPVHLTLAQIGSSAIVGLGGGNILTQLAQKKAEQIAKKTLAATLRATS